MEDNMMWNCVLQQRGPAAEQCARLRRNFLRGLIAAGLPVAAGTAHGGRGEASNVPTGKILPSIHIKDKVISRLVAGANPIGGWSYGTPKLTQHMLNYFTV